MVDLDARIKKQTAARRSVSIAPVANDITDRAMVSLARPIGKFLRRAGTVSFDGSTAGVAGYFEGDGRVTERDSLNRFAFHGGDKC